MSNPHSDVRCCLVTGVSPLSLQLALGASGADVWKRSCRAAQVLTSARTDDSLEGEVSRSLVGTLVAHVYHPLDQMLRSGDGELAAVALRLLVHLDDPFFSQRRSATVAIRALGLSAVILLDRVLYDQDGVHSRSRICRCVLRDVGGSRRHTRTTVFVRRAVLSILGRTTRVLSRRLSNHCFRPGASMGPPGARTDG